MKEKDKETPSTSSPHSKTWASTDTHTCYWRGPEGCKEMQSEATTGLGVVAEGRQGWRWAPEEGSRDVYR